MSIQKEFNELIADAAGCKKCPAMCNRSAVLSELNGATSARIMFIGEAPGRKGADQTRVPFSGDQSGKNFDRFLDSIGLSRSDIFITSAALCNPRTNSGANRKPTQTEISNCSDFLKRTFATVNPEVVVTLGSVALNAIKTISSHTLTLKDAARVHQWNGRTLVPIYHPSPQVLASHRREAEQLGDYQIIAQTIKSLKEKPPAAFKARRALVPNENRW